MSWMDVLIIVIFAINVIKGWKNGLVLSFFYMASFIVAGIMAKIYYPVVSKYIMGDSTIFMKVQSLIGQRFQTAVNNNVLAEGIVGNRSIFEVLKFPKSIENIFMKSDVFKDYSISAMNGVNNYVSDVLAQMFIDFVSMIIIFFVVKMLLFIVGHLLDGIASLPILKQFNSLGGIVFGFIKGAFIVFIFLAIITPFTTMTDSGVLIEGLEKSILAKALYNYNPIIGLIHGMIKG